MTHVGFLFVDILLMILGDVELNQGTRNKTLQHVYKVNSRTLTSFRDVSKLILSRGGIFCISQPFRR